MFHSNRTAERLSNFIKVLLFLIPGFLFLFQPTLAQQGSSSQDSTLNITNPLSQTPRQYTIQGVEVVGEQTVRESFIPSTSGLTKGTTITVPGDDIPKAIRRLYRTGLFSNIQINKKRTSLNGIYLEIVVQEQPRLDKYILTGIDKSKREELKKRLSLLSGFAVTKSAKQQARTTIKQFFSDKGYWNTKVDIKTTITDTTRNRVRLKFDIDPGKRLEVEDIRFRGNESFEEKDLRKSLETIEEDRWWKIFSKKLFKRKKYKKAKENLISFYKEHGYRDIRITSDTVYVYNLEKDEKGIRVQITVDEGSQYYVRNITWEGNSVYSDEHLTEVLGFQKGDVFNHKKYQNNLRPSQSGNDVTSIYKNAGYLFFRVRPNIKVVKGDSLDLHFYLFEDEIATINEVSFGGNTKTHDDVVRRTLRTVPGDKYSRQAIMRTLRELGTLGYFKKKKIKPSLDRNRQERTVNIHYQLEEATSTDNFEFSGGFGGRNIGIILSARVNFNNFSTQNIFDASAWDPLPSGDGQKLSLGVQVTGGGFQSYNFGFQEPWLMGYPTSFGINGSYDILNFRGSSQRNEMLSGSISLGKKLNWPDDYFSVQSVLKYQLFNIAGGSRFLAEGTSNILSLKGVLERNSLDNFISPNKGSKFSLSAEIAPPIAKFSQFYKLISKYQHHTPLWGDLVLTNEIQYGYYGYLTSDQQSSFKKFYIGGTEMQQRQSFVNQNIDLRGFPGGSRGSISPYVDGQHVGGRVYSKYTLEMRYPAVNNKQVRLIPYAFMDAGNSFLNFNRFNPFEVKRSAGFGARVFMPILGLVDLSYGYRLDGIPGTSVDAGQWEFLFNIGAPFK